MGVLGKVLSEMKDAVALTIFVVIGMAILLTFKSVGSLKSSSTINTTIDTAVGVLDDPITWIGLVVIGVIGFALFKWVGNRKGM